MNRARLYINIKLLLLAVLTLNLSGCELDERVDDLTGGYEGAFIDRLTGEKVATEYYGAKLKLLDLEYGNVAVPLEYNTLPEGTYRNTKVYPSRYKVWANGPFFELVIVRCVSPASSKFFLVSGTSGPLPIYVLNISIGGIHG